METHSALSVILCPRKLPKCVYELSILYQAHEIGNNVSVLASLNIWDTWNYYLILLAVSKETKQKCMFGSGFNFAEDWNIQSLSAQTQISPYFPLIKKSSFFRAWVNWNRQWGKCHPQSISAFSPHLFSFLSALIHGADHCVNFTSLFFINCG